MKFPIIVACLLLTSVLSGFGQAQMADDVRITNLKEFREAAPPEPLGMSAAGLLAPEVKRNAEVQVWMAYAKARQLYAQENNLELPSVEGEIAPEFREEVAARAALAAALKEKGRRVGKTHRSYSKELQVVIEAGFFEEYIFTVHNQPDWDTTDRALRLDEYKTWAAGNIPDHQPLSHASRIARARNRTGDVFLVIDSELEVESEAAFWLKYCMFRINFRKDNGLPFDLLIGEEATPSFKEELAARRGLLKSFDDVQDSLCEETRSAFKEMVKAEAKGYLREYVWKYLHCDGWEEPAELNLADFETWASAELSKHIAPSRASLVGR